MLNIDLRGRRALVAGVADDGGFGFAIAKALGEAGASVCVGTHLHFSDTPYYQRWPEVRDALIDSGIRHVRDTQLASTVRRFARV